MWKQSLFPVTDASHVGEVRRAAVKFSESLGFDEVLQSEIAIVVTELSTNLYKHAQDGRILLSLGENSLDVLSIDRGPGMASVPDSMRDGVSTRGTSGNGLSSIQRNSHFFEVYTQPGKGTVAYVRYNRANSAPEKFCAGGIAVPFHDEPVCGDNFVICQDGNKIKVMLADGLGHGLQAYDASLLAVETFRKVYPRSITDSMNQLHLALRSTRGAAVSIAEMDVEKKIMNFCGVGNVAGALFSFGESKRCVSHAGTVGVQIRKVQNFAYPMNRDSILVMASDGVSTHLDLKDYLGLTLKHPFVIAGVLYRDFGKSSDDATVVVVKEAE